jgi:acetyl-CoA acetyltransferase
LDRQPYQKTPETRLELRYRERYGIASSGIGGGQGIVLVVENAQMKGVRS